ncbi:MAG: ATP-binding protein [Bacteroidia bacterium]|nr:ATP-binding protein [Bacteroidia bacterium]
MEHTQRLFDELDSAAEALKAENGRLSRKLLARVRELLPEPCNDEEIAALALVVHQTGRGALEVQGCDLISLLSRRAPGTPRWDVVLPRLAEKGFIALKNPDDPTDAFSELSGAALRNLSVTLLLECEEAAAFPGYADNRAYFRDCFAYIDALYDFLQQQHPGGRSGRRSGRTSGASAPAETESMRRRIGILTLHSTCRLPLEELRNREGLSELDWQMLLLLCRKELSCDSIEVRELAPFFGSDPFSMYELRRYFSGEGALVARGLVSLNNGGSVMRMDVDLRQDLLELVLAPSCGGTSVAPDREAEETTDSGDGFTSNGEYLDAWLGFLENLYDEAVGQRPARRRASSVTRTSLSENPLYRELLSRTACSTADIPLERLIREHGFGETERFIIGTAMLAGMKDTYIDIPDVLVRLSASLTESWKLRRHFEPSSPLLRHGFVAVRTMAFGSPDIAMPAAMLRRVTAEQEPETATLLVSNSGLFDVRIPRHTLAAVKLDAAEHLRLDAAARGVCGEVRERLRTWGVSGVTASRPTESLLLLFSGEPGTGKTFAAEGLAGTLGRPLLVTDISRILSKWVGESQQNVAALFSEYRELCASAAAPPVLLLNECDQFLTHRIAESGHSVDRMYSQMQSLFLENLESFPGVLVATTNFTEAMDEAFSRRFDEKILFQRPDLSVRRELWEAHIPEGVPRASDVRLEDLAAAWPFSGGQIAIAAAAALRSAALRGDVLRMNDLQTACMREAEGSFETASRTLGFRQ